MYKNGFYEVTGKPIKSYDGLPSDIKDSIDKLDKLYYNQKLPHFFDLVIAFMNSAIIFLLGFLQHNNQYLIIGFIMSVFFILFLTKTFLDIGNMIIIDYKSIFEE